MNITGALPSECFDEAKLSGTLPSDTRVYCEEDWRKQRHLMCFGCS